MTNPNHERVAIPLDPETALRGLMHVDPEDDAEDDAWRDEAWREAQALAEACDYEQAMGYFRH